MTGDAVGYRRNAANRGKLVNTTQCRKALPWQRLRVISVSTLFDDSFATRGSPVVFVSAMVGAGLGLRVSIPPSDAVGVGEIVGAIVPPVCEWSGVSGQAYSQNISGRLLQYASTGHSSSNSRVG